MKLRGLVTIEFFKLDDVIARKDLMRERLLVLEVLHQLLVKATDQEDPDAAAQVDSMVAPTALHANCARSFRRLFRSDRTQACEVLGDARNLLQSMSP